MFVQWQYCGDNWHNFLKVSIYDFIFMIYVFHKVNVIKNV